MKEQKFYVCERCGNMVGMIHESGVQMVCCGQKMTQVIPGTVEASKEKHIPTIVRDGNTVTVTVGSVLHPMSEEHNISWIYLQTTSGGQRKVLSPNGQPQATFILYDEEPLAAFAYCNLHGLWKTEI